MAFCASPKYRWFSHLFRWLFPVAIMAAFLVMGEARAPDATQVEWAVVAFVAYALSHVLRAVRLALIGLPILPLRARLLFFLHFHTAPVSLMMPFKLGELYRLHQLATLSGDWIKAIIVMVVERACDAIILIALCLALIFVGSDLPPNFQMGAMILMVAMIVLLFIFIVGDTGLLFVQTYLFTTQPSPNVRFLLRGMASVRQTVGIAKRCLKGNLFLFLLISAAIWGCEAVVFAAIAPTQVREAGGFIIETISMVLMLSPDVSANGALDFRLLYLAIVTLVLCVIWPFATIYYVKWINDSGRRGVKAEGRSPLSFRQYPRRIKIHVPRSARRSP